VAAGAATTRSAASAATKTGPETGTEGGAETRAEAGAESERPLVSARVVAEVFAEFLPGRSPGAVQSTSLYGTGSKPESEAWPTGEWLAGRSEWVVHICSPYVS
jgi:hypothetical protein